jgi:arylsulfatase A-like enzyme
MVSDPPLKPQLNGKRPNVLVVLFDDVGFSDFGCYGSEIETPTIDRLANRGIRYTGFHTTAMCSTTRASLLTGRNHHSVGMGCLANFDSGLPGYRGKIAADAATLPEILRENGYRNYMIGKWHATPLTESGPTGPFDGWPLGRGFDRYYGFMDAETDQYAPELVRDNTHVDPPGTFESGYHLTEDLIDNAIRMLTEHHLAIPNDPWLCWVALGACHAPHQVPKPFIDKYDKVFAKGWDKTREDRLAKQRALGIVPENTVLPERNDHIRPWDDHEIEEQRLFVRLQSAYAGMLDHSDVQLARLIDILEAMGELDNTIVLVLSDNGASQEGGPLGFVNAMGPFNGIGESIATKISRIDDIGGPDTHSNFPWGWAMAANTPLRRYKQNTHGGGIRDPLVISWPTRIADRGTLRHQFCHASDLLPTLLDAVDVEVPARIRGVRPGAIEGVSFAKTFTDVSAITDKHEQHFEMFGHRGLWSDGWKAVAFHPSGAPFESDWWELYHLDTDFNERENLASTHPEKMAELEAKWWAAAERYNVLPLDDRFGARFVEYAERHRNGRTSYVFWHGMGHIPTDVAPDLRSRSYTIRAHIDAPKGAEGVLVSHGDATSGYSLFIRNGHLEHDLNIGGSHQRVRSNRPIPTNEPCTVAFRMERIGNAGLGTLLINDEPAGSFETNDIFMTFISWSGLDIGLDRGSPVSDYVAPFCFTGNLEKVVVTLNDDQELDGEAVGHAEIARE